MLAVERGLDQTDEALYVLNESSPHPTTWNTPWEWNLRPLFRLAAERIDRVRTIGGVVLMLAGALCGVVTVSAARRWVGREHTGRRAAPGLAAGVVVGGSGSLTFYAGYLRVPGFNWLNLLGTLIAMCGLGLVVASPVAVSRLAATFWSISAAVVGLGWFVAAPAKPSAPVLLALVAGFVVSATRGVRRASLVVVSAAGWMVVWALLATAVGIWPRWPFPTLARVTRLPPVAREHHFGPAIGQLISTPWNVATELASAPPAVVVVAASAIAVAVRLRTRRRQEVLAGVLLVLGLVAGWRVAGLPTPGWATFTPTTRLFFAGAVTGALCLVIAALGALAAIEPRQALRVVPIVGGLVIAAFVFGFGSSNLPYPQASTSMVLVLIAALVPVVVQERSAVRSALAMTPVVVLTIGLVAGVLIDGRERPYRSAPIDDQTVPVDLAGRGGVIDLDPAVAAEVEALRAGAAAGGWEPGTPLLGVIWRWSSFLPLVLDAKAPPSAMVTLFGWPGSLALAADNLADLDPRIWSRAWVATTDPSSLSATAASDVAAVLAMLPGSVGTTFPSGYSCVTEVGSTQLWRPREPGDPPSAGCG